MSAMTPEFEYALRRVTRDVQLDDGAGADLIAVGVQRDDCLALLGEMLTDEQGNDELLTVELLAVLVQCAVATGVWLERERWQPTTERGAA